MAKRSHEEIEAESSSDPPGGPTMSPHEDHQTDIEVKTKIVHLDSEVDASTTTAVMQCSLPGHCPNLPFMSFSDYDVHYAKQHTNRCTACAANLPTPHLLSLHHREHHDPFVTLSRDKGEKTYACFVEDCDKVCATAKKRKMHLIDKHGYPRQYEFRVVDRGIEGRTTLLRENGSRRDRGGRRRSLTLEKKDMKPGGPRDGMDVDLKGPVVPAPLSSITESRKVQTSMPSEGIAPAVQSQAVPNKSEDTMDIDELASAMSALRFVPTSVRLGKTKARPSKS